MYVRSAAVSRVADIQLRFCDAVGTLIQNIDGTNGTTSTSDWVRVSATGVCPVGASTAQLFVRVLSTAIGEVHYFDGGLLEQSSTVGSYFDGSVNDLPSNEFAVAQGWNGTANASTSFLTYGTEYEISNVLEVNCNVGRRAPLDAYRANTASVQIRYPSGYATPNPDFIPGTEMRINTINNASEQQVFVGEIADVEVTYGKPYASSIGPADILTLSCESYFATMGRTQGNGYVLSADDLNAQCNDLFANFGFDIVTPTGFGAETLFASTTLNGTIADWVNLVALSMNGRIQDAGPSFGLIIFNQYFKPANFLGDFSDDGTVGTNRYTEITFDSLADNYYTQVTVDPESFAEQTVQTGSAPYRSYKVNTLNASTGQALDYANYLLSTYQDPQLAISSFRVFIDDQSGNPTFGCTDLGTAVSVKFRGTTYNCIIEGARFSGSPDRGVYATYYVSGQDLNNYLLLDNAVYGRLDFNKLGY
jgi:hypothetical protein